MSTIRCAFFVYNQMTKCHIYEYFYSLPLIRFHSVVYFGLAIVSLLCCKMFMVLAGWLTDWLARTVTVQKLKKLIPVHITAQALRCKKIIERRKRLQQVRTILHTTSQGEMFEKSKKKKSVLIKPLIRNINMNLVFVWVWCKLEYTLWFHRLYDLPFEFIIGLVAKLHVEKTFEKQFHIKYYFF